ncbi:MAG: hypothetical protein MJ076_04155 [Clostridia bacterium]|nr:hypothetical protein [Clostridia bacterium]
MGKEQPCAGNCGKTVSTGFFSSGSYLVDEKYYCLECREKLPKYVGAECYSCAYYGVDANYDGYCKRFNDKYVDRYNKACESYESR